MGLIYNKKATLVTEDYVDSVTVVGMTIVSAGNTADGFKFEGYHNNGGCGSPDSGVLILLKDDIPWNRISFEFQGTGSASCWSFSRPGGGYGQTTGTGDGNLLDFSRASGDRTYDGYLTYIADENVGGISVEKLNACDNNADNFMRLNTGTFRRFRMNRRRNADAALAGVHHGRSCNSTGTGATSIIQRIYIWQED